MTAPIWVTAPGLLGTITERISTTTSVLASGTNIVYNLLAGQLPTGIYLNTGTGVISGTPVSVPNELNFEFVIRAENQDGVNDRTFNLIVEGPSVPNWLTPAGPLPIGRNGEYYTFGKEYVDFQLNADTDILVPGNSLKYYIADNNGSLPPGLTLTSSGRIFGFINDTLSLDWQASISGGYDSMRFDAYPYDYGTTSTTLISLYKPESINKIYQFYVTVTDGILSSNQLFSIEITDPNSLRADNTFIDADTLNYDASVGNLVSPLWRDYQGNLLPRVANLGIIRAARNQVFTLHDYDPYPYVGPVTWDWSLTVNPEIQLITDSNYNDLGRATTNLYGTSRLYFKGATTLPSIGQKIRLDEYINGYDSTTYTIVGVGTTGLGTGFCNLDRPLVLNVITADGNLPDSRVVYVGSPSQHPPGMNLDSTTGELYGYIPYQPSFSQSYKFTVRLTKTDAQTGNTTGADQIFTLTVKGDIDTTIEFVSPENLGSLLPGQISNISVVATHTNSLLSINYELIDGVLPQGLTLNVDGTIQGKIEKLPINLGSGYIVDAFDTFDTVIDGGTTTIDHNATSVDNKYYFTVRANDVYRTSQVDKTFYINVNQDYNARYTRIFLTPFLPAEKRQYLTNFSNNLRDYCSSILYRPNDPEFGVQKNLKLLLEAGIESLTLDTWASAAANFYRKSFYFGEIKTILATDFNGNPYYEIIYLDIVDDQMIGNSGPLSANNLANMQTNLESIQVTGRTIYTDERYLPLFMSTLQSNGVPIGFIKAVPICYVLPGNSAKVMSYIKSSGFEFNQISFESDRLLIETFPDPNEKNLWVFFPTLSR